MNAGREVGGALPQGLVGSPDYRPDIDGLRAIAVLAVVVFHARSTWMPGGFAGVDVFFVISGYLITGIVHREIQAGRFSLIGFYERRVRRIFPALLVTLLATILAGALILMPEDLQDLGRDTLGTLFFVSNVRSWLTTDYFGDVAGIQPLLHMWSLAVEEQFYLFLPLLMLGMTKFAPRQLKPVITALLLLSFGLSCAWVWIDANANYYLLHTRAWELLVGSVLALGMVPAVHNARANQVISLFGLAAVAGTLVMLHGGSPFPAWNALPICMGTAALIHTGESGRTWPSKLLSWWPFTRVGLISYSIYLVHLPIIAFTRYYIVRDPKWSLAIGLASISVLLGWLTWRFVEQPFRSRHWFNRESIFRMAAATSALVMVVCIGTLVLNGLPSRPILVRFPTTFRVPSTQVLRIANYVDYRKTSDYSLQFRRGQCFATETDGYDYAFCLRLSPTKKNLVVLGDSHAAMYWRAISEQLPNWNVLQANASGCHPVVDQPGRAKCRNLINLVLSRLVDTGRVDAVILAGRWTPNDPKYLRKTYARFKQAGVPVVVIGPTTEYHFPAPLIIARSELGGGNSQKHVITGPWKIERTMQSDAAQAGVNYVSALAIECPNRNCRTLTPDGGPMQFDYGHLTLSGARSVVRQMNLAPRLLQRDATRSYKTPI